jgi:glycosyltransferase involved in cell wall biosynthesis
MFKSSELHRDCFTQDQARHVSPLTKCPNLVLSGLALANPHVGQGVYSLRLIEGLVRHLHDAFVVVAPSAIARPAEVPEGNFVRIHQGNSSLPGIVRHAVTANRLARFVAREFPDAVFHSPGPIWSLTKPARTVVTLHDCIYRHFANYNGRFFLRRLLMQGTERFAAKASLVLTDSEYSRHDLVSRVKLPSAKIEVLYPWVGNEFLRPINSDAVSAMRTKLQLPAKFWLYLGGYDFRKNVAMMLNAYASAARGRELPPLVLAGRTPEQRNRATCNVKGILDRLRLPKEQVVLSGPVDANDLPALYRAAGLLIYPSLMEGFGLPPAEATAMGTAVLSSRAGSLPEVITNPDSLFDPHDLDALVEKLLAAADDETRFVSELSPQFKEEFGIARYLELIGNLDS